MNGLDRPARDERERLAGADEEPPTPWPAARAHPRPSRQSAHPTGMSQGLLSERVAGQLERLIAERNLQPGDRLPSGRQLTDSLAVSRTVVRDAVAILQRRGLVEPRVGSGVYVRDAGREAVADVLGQMLRRDAISFPELLETRRLLEVHSAGMAAARANGDDLAALRSTLRRMEQHEAMPSRFVEADVAFHEAVAQAAGNRVLSALLGSLRPFLLQGMLLGASLEGAVGQAITDHAGLLRSIEDRDAGRARAQMDEHMNRSYSEWLAATRAGPDQARAGEDPPPG